MSAALEGQELRYAGVVGDGLGGQGSIAPYEGEGRRALKEVAKLGRADARRRAR